MAKKKSLKRDLIEWGIFIGIISILYLTGLHTPVLGALQGLILKTGIIQPPIDQDEKIKADYNFHLEDVEGNIISFEQFKGKTIFLNFWATWCPPCIAEMPDIDDLHNEIDNDNIVFVMISLDDDFEKAKAFVDKKQFDLPIYKLRSPLPDAFESSSIPTTFVVSPAGEIVMTNQGMAKYNSERFKKFLTELSQ